MKNQSKDMDFLTAAFEVLKSGLIDSSTKVSHVAVYAGSEMIQNRGMKVR